MKKQKTKKTKPTKTKKVSKAKVKVINAAKASQLKKVAPAPAAEETMDRIALKAVVAQLKDMGSDIKVLKSDTDDGLQKKVNEALQQLPAPDMIKKLEGIDPTKLLTVLKKDCLGIFIDLSNVSCVHCMDSVTCVREFIKNLKGGMAIASTVMTAPVVEKKVSPPAATPVSRYEADRLVFVRDQPNPNPEGDDYHGTFQAVLDEQPGTLSELRAIVERDFDIESDADFMKFVTTMRDKKEGIIKLDADLSDKDKIALRKAGYDV